MDRRENVRARRSRRVHLQRSPGGARAGRAAEVASPTSSSAASIARRRSALDVEARPPSRARSARAQLRRSLRRRRPGIVRRSRSAARSSRTCTRASVRSGYVAAKSMLIGAALGEPNSAARSDPAASITARTSSIRSSSVGSRRSGRIRQSRCRACRRGSAGERRRAAQKPRTRSGISQPNSTWETQPGTKTRSIGPRRRPGRRC